MLISILLRIILNIIGGGLIGWGSRSLKFTMTGLIFILAANLTGLLQERAECNLRVQTAQG